MNFLSNYNLAIHAQWPVYIGDNVMIASNVLISSAQLHILSRLTDVGLMKYWFDKKDETNSGQTQSIRIGNNVWICAGVTICPGVSIGENSVIGAGSVVFCDIPANVLAFGSPCRVIRPITLDDKLIPI